MTQDHTVEGQNRLEDPLQHDGQPARSESGAALLDPFLYRLGPIDLLSWDPVRKQPGSRFGATARNFGDVLGRTLVERIAEQRGLDIDSPWNSDEDRPTLLGVGSILHLAPEGATVWGSGVNFKVPSRLNRFGGALDVRAVRGPLSARVLTRAGCDVPAVFGDPMLLLPRFAPELMRWRVLDGSDVLVVPNLNDFAILSAQAEALGMDTVDPAAPAEHVLRKIASANLVVGSSLHAIVIADALGIPARFVRSREEHELKYRDYLAGTGRPATRIASTIDQAVALGAHEPAEFSADTLLEAFPDDLWSSGEQRAVPPRKRRASPSSSGWDPLIDARGSVDLKEVSVAAMQASLDSARSDAEHSLRADQASVRQASYGQDIPASIFAEVASVRETTGAIATLDDFSARDQDLLMAVESGHVGLAYRAVWLDLVGPHAFGHLVPLTWSADSVLFVAIRPGRLRNRLLGLRLCRHADGDLRILADLPVFDIYRMQWSIDVTIAVDRAAVDGAPIEELVVQYREAQGEWTSVPLSAPPQGHGPLSDYPQLPGSEAESVFSDTQGESS